MNKEQKTDTILLFVFAACGVLIHILLNGQYGFHRDELDFILNARQLDWGYVSYPPMTPFFARLGLELFGESLRGLRVLPAIAQGIAMVLAGLMARDMGGQRNAQLLSAFAVFISPISLMGGSVIMYFAFDYLWWVLMAFFVVRLLTTEDARYWLGIGAAIGLGMLTKYTMGFWVLGLIAGVLLTDTRRYLRSKWLYLGAGLSLLIFLPNLIWQARHDFIALEYLSSIHARDVAWGRAEGFLPNQLIETTNPFSLPLWLAGLIVCLFGASMMRFRILAWMFLVTFVLFFLSQGRSYYTGPSYVMLMAAGAVWFESWLGTRTQTFRRVGLGLLWGLQIIGGMVYLLVGKPVVPINSPLWDIVIEFNGEFVEMIGWKELTAQVAGVYEALPEQEKPRTVILASNYGEAGALDLYGKQYGLPPIISRANGYWYRGYGDPEPQTVITVGFDYSHVGMFFHSCKSAGKVTNSYGVENEESTHHTGIFVCRNPNWPWSKIWPQLQEFQ